MKKLWIFLTVFVFVGVSSPTFAHPGKLDSNGCHTCRTKCAEKWGLK